MKTSLEIVGWSDEELVKWLISRYGKPEMSHFDGIHQWWLSSGMSPYDQPDLSWSGHYVPAQRQGWWGRALGIRASSEKSRLTASEVAGFLGATKNDGAE